MTDKIFDKTKPCGAVSPSYQTSACGPFSDFPELHKGHEGPHRVMVWSRAENKYVVYKDWVA